LAITTWQRANVQHAAADYILHATCSKCASPSLCALTAAAQGHAYRRDRRECLGKLLVDRVELLAVAAPAATFVHTGDARKRAGCSTRRAPCKARDAACAVQRAKCSVAACNVRRAAAVPHETIQQSNTIGVCYGAKNSTTTSFVASVTIDRTVAPTTTCACHVAFVQL